MFLKEIVFIIRREISSLLKLKLNENISIRPTKVESKKIERKMSKYQNVKTFGMRNNLREKIEEDV